MRLSQMLFVTLRDDPADAEIPSHKLLLRAGYIRRMGNGLYAYLPLMQRVLQKIEVIIREEMNRVGAQECLMPQLQPSELWQSSGRWDAYTSQEEIMFSLTDRVNKQLCLGPTHEEVVTALAKDLITSYRQLPTTLYQIQTKFRDEIRPRFGLMRGREFIMKDAYSFHSNEQSLQQTYGAMDASYKAIFKRCGLNFCGVEADSGAIGGTISKEFMALSEYGEDEILYTDDGLFAINVEKDSTLKVGDPAPHDPSLTLKSARGIEVGHIFQLGTKYSQAMKATFTNEHGEQQPLVMGCYGIGVSRLAQAVAEQTHDESGIVWPVAIAPYQVVVIAPNQKNATQVAFAEKIYQQLLDDGVDVLFDDRDERAGVKFKDADLIGIPFKLITGKSIVEGKVEMTSRLSKHSTSLNVDNAVEYLTDLLSKLYSLYPL